MEERILEILKTLVAMKSVSCSTVEVEPAEWFAGFFKTLPYFEKHPEDTGLYARSPAILTEEKYRTLFFKVERRQTPYC